LKYLWGLVICVVVEKKKGYRQTAFFVKEKKENEILKKNT
jgi:hypothetical protein